MILVCTYLITNLQQTSDIEHVCWIQENIYYVT
mgnify:CR=1 FL=1